ncbi:hypothetical protein AURDEDRAFT_113504 [Auricularia subglabra TFB-10046 SS5]|nr:hypothetical protein AURDEDRAFT_113504 [Auricularia subglabra TFB-10046 SS5]
MHFTTLIALATVAIGVSAGVAEDCGALGVFKPESLPAGVDPAAVRPCKEHPLGNVTQPAGSLDKRACWFGDPYGCTDGYCWKTCNTQGSGQWCWTAWDGGWGGWRTCASNSDCSPNSSADCGQGGCDKCGCSC